MATEQRFDVAKQTMVLVQVPDPPPTSAVVPQSIAGWRGRAVMVLYGLDAAILDAIAAMPDATQRTVARIGYTTADTFTRDSVLLNTVLKALGKSDAEIDGYFTEAAALPS